MRISERKTEEEPDTEAELDSNVDDQVVEEVSLETKSDSICDLEPESGMCKAYFQRYFYNSRAKECQIFIYGGCGGENSS